MRRIIERIDKYQREHPVLAFPFAVFTRYKEHNGARLAANVSYFAFFSIFPLMVAFVSILGLVLEDNQDLLEDIKNGAIADIPLVGDQIGGQGKELTGSLVVVIVGIAGALWAGTKMIDALTFALNEEWDVPASERPVGVLARLKGIIVLGVFGLGMAGGTVLSSLPAAFDMGALGPLVGLIVSGVANMIVIGLSIILLVARPLKPRDVWRGALVAGIAILILQQAGVWLVGQLKGASDTYGTFGGIIGLLGWFHLIFQCLLLSAEIDVVRDNGLVPRTLTPKIPDATAGDRHAVELDIQRVKRDPRFGFTVDYDEAETTE